jgi:hypothetical protein
MNKRSRDIDRIDKYAILEILEYMALFPIIIYVFNLQ